MAFSAYPLTYWLLMIKNFVFYICTCFFLSVLFFITLEITAHWYLKSSPRFSSLSQHPAYQSASWIREFEKDVTPFKKAAYTAKQYTPFSLWREYPYQSETFNVSPEGYRHTMVPKNDEQSGILRIFFFGGSTLFSSQVPDQETIPSLVAEQLHEHFPHHRLDIRNYGIDGMVSTQEYYLLLELLRNGERPDLVVFYDGINDTFNHVLAERPHTFLDRFSTVLDRKAAVKEFAIALLQKSSMYQLTKKEHTLPDISQTVLQQRITNMLMQYHDRALFITKALGPYYNFESLFAWQSNLFNTNKILTSFERELHADQPLQLKEAFERTDKEVHTIVKNLPNALDCRSCFDAVTESIFVDPYHVTAPGNRAVATVFVKTILPILQELVKNSSRSALKMQGSALPSKTKSQ